MSNIQDQRTKSVASFQLYEAARAKAAKYAPVVPVETPALTTVEIAQREEHDLEASASVSAFHRLQEAQAEAHAHEASE